MGRRMYLERLALGRSPFEAVDDEDGIRNEPSGAEPVEAGAEYVQQYDTKGRPVNPSTEARNAEMRDAQNSVLALVGVVESKETEDRETQWRYAALRDERHSTLVKEHERGDEMEGWSIFIGAFLTFWPESLVTRMQAGLDASSTSFIDILLSEIDSAGRGGFAGMCSTFFGGIPACFVYHLFRMLLHGLREEGFSRLQIWLNQRLSRKAMKGVNNIIVWANRALAVGLHVAILPIRYWFEVQRLSLAPALPLLPGWRSLLPSSYTGSYHAIMWTSTIGIPAIRRICSPATLLIASGQIWDDKNSETPVLSEFTEFQYPPINAPPSDLSCFRRGGGALNPLGQIVYQGSLIRNRLMRWFGWNLQYISANAPHPKKHENNHVPRAASDDHDEDSSSTSSDDENDDGLQHIYRSTMLVHHSPTELAETIDRILAKLVLLPVDCLVSVIVARSYLSSSLPKTAFAAHATSNLRTGWSWRGTGSYLSKVGLSVAFHFSAELCVFFILNTLCRWQGVSKFDWGTAGVNKCGCVGGPQGFVYRNAGEQYLHEDSTLWYSFRLSEATRRIAELTV